MFSQIKLPNFCNSKWRPKKSNVDHMTLTITRARHSGMAFFTVATQERLELSRDHLEVINTTIRYSLLGRFSRILYFEGFDLRAVDTFIQWISLSRR